jgi:hypothetical protein
VERVEAEVEVDEEEAEGVAGDEAASASSLLRTPVRPWKEGSKFCCPYHAWQQTGQSSPSLRRPQSKRAREVMRRYITGDIWIRL